MTNITLVQCLSITPRLIPVEWGIGTVTDVVCSYIDESGVLRFSLSRVNYQLHSTPALEVTKFKQRFEKRHK